MISQRAKPYLKIYGYTLTIAILFGIISIFIGHNDLIGIAVYAVSIIWIPLSIIGAAATVFLDWDMQRHDFNPPV